MLNFHSIVRRVSLGAVLIAATFAQAETTNESTLRIGSGLEATSLGRDLLKYVVRCALPHGQSVVVPHYGTQEHLDGEFGLAPNWSHAPLDDSGRRWISACVLGFVNALGVHVLVSVRGPALQGSVTDDERATFGYQEAAFYGDLFGSSPIAYVCRGDSGGRSASREQRVCSDDADQPGLSRCGMLVTGQCADVCSTHDATDHFYAHCRGGERDYAEVVTIFLRSSP